MRTGPAHGSGGCAARAGLSYYYVYVSVESLALRRQLRSPRAVRRPSLQVARDRQVLAEAGTEDHVTFRGSHRVSIFPGRGLQIHPLVHLQKANLIHGASVREEPGCDREALAGLDEMGGCARPQLGAAWEVPLRLRRRLAAVERAGWLRPPQSRPSPGASQLLGRPDYLTWARRGLGAFQTAPDGSAHHRPEGGVAYLQYSFAPRVASSATPSCSR